MAEARRTTVLQPVEQKPHSQKDRQDEKAEGYVSDEWIKKMWHIYTMEYYSAIKRNEMEVSWDVESGLIK